MYLPAGLLSIPGLYKVFAISITSSRKLGTAVRTRAIGCGLHSSPRVALCSVFRPNLENRREGIEKTKEVIAMLKQWAVDAGLPAKPLYKVTEISKATGIAVSTLYGEIGAGRLKARLPVGRKRGMLVACEWFDEWMKEGIDGE